MLPMAQAPETLALFDEHKYHEFAPHEDEQEQLSSFAQTQKEQDEAFYRQFPAARPAANSWSMVPAPRGFNGLVFAYPGHGSDHGKSQWSTDSQGASNTSLWGNSGSSSLLAAHTFSELAVLSQPSFSAANSSLLPEQHLHYDYSSPHLPYDSGSPDASTSASEPPPTPMYSGSSTYGSPTPQRQESPGPQEATYFTSTFTTQPQIPFDSSKPLSAEYRRNVDEEPIMDYLPAPTEPTYPSSSGEGGLYSMSSPSIPYSGSSSEMIPLNPASRKSRRHTLPIPENEHSRAFYYKLPRANSSPQAPAPPSHSRRAAPQSPPKPEDKKQPTLACYFCRGRKIACGAPEPDAADRTCNQCSRRKLKCEYPKESRRGMRKKKTDDAPDGTSPPVQQ